MPPIKRSPELQPLSRDHHTALIVAFRVMHGLGGKAFAGPIAGFDSLLVEAGEFHDDHFLPHAEAEETILVPSMRAATGLDEAGVERLLADHEQLVSLIRSARDEALSPAERSLALRGYAELLERHVRFEERELFPAVEDTLARDALVQVGERLAEYEAARDPSCRLRT